MPLRAYFDASALIKRYSPETGSSWVNVAFDDLYPRFITCAVLGLLEVVAALVRHHNDGRLSHAGYNQAMLDLRAELIEHTEFVITTIDDATAFSALDLILQHNLNASDAVLLKSALDLRQELQVEGDNLVLCTCDKRLARAAQREGLLTFDPETDTLDDWQRLLAA